MLMTQYSSRGVSVSSFFSGSAGNTAAAAAAEAGCSDYVRKLTERFDMVDANTQHACRELLTTVHC
jgi:hypothetical protein